MFTLVLDDDPTGTQSVSGVHVLLRWTPESIAAALRSDGAVYVQTNSRAIPEAEAVALAERIKQQIAEVEALVGERLLVVLRGDSTLRGHVFAESDVFTGDDGCILFVPAFPAGGRTTVDCVHRVRVGGAQVPAGETEFARDPVFGYRASNLVDWVRERGARQGIPVSLADLRASRGGAVADALVRARPGEVVVPDAETDADIELIHAGLLAARSAGVHVVVRSGAPLAAVSAGHASRGLLARPLTVAGDGGILVVCGSHTGASTAQLERLAASRGLDPVEIPTDAARTDPDAAGGSAADRARERLRAEGIAVLSSERTRRAEYDSLADGELVMRALMAATRSLAAEVSVIVSKGGITGAEVARTGLGAEQAFVRGQVAPGISVWDMVYDGAPRTQIVVPGNVGESDALVDVLDAVRPIRNEEDA